MRIERNNSPFSILEVSEDCDDSDVKLAYRRLAMRYHPDRNKEAGAERHFKRLQMAYQLLRTQSSRNMVLNIMNLGGEGDPVAGGYGGSQWRKAGHKAYKPDDFSYTASHSHGSQGLRSLLVNLGYQTILQAMMLTRAERLPLHSLVLVPAALFFAGLHADGEMLEPRKVGLALALGIGGATLSDFLVQFVTFTNRYHMRNRLNNVIGFVSIISASMLILSIDLNGVMLLPTMLGIDPDLLRRLSFLVLGSAIYLWFFFCFLFQSSHRNLETVLVWLWVAYLEYFLPTVM